MLNLHPNYSLLYSLCFSSEVVNLISKRDFPCNVEGDVPIPLTILGGFVGIKSIPRAAIKNSMFIKIA